MRTRPERDEGFTLVELLVVVSLLALVASVLSASFVTVLRVTPAAQFRIDDARATRSLQTWLVRDIASTPPQVGVAGSDGVTFSDADATGLQRCGATGVHVVNLRWTDAGTNVWYVADYSIEAGSVVRRACDSVGASSVQTLTADVSTDPCDSGDPHSMKGPDLDDGDSYDIDSVALCLVAVSEDGPLSGSSTSSEIRLSVSSRNGW